MADIDNIKSIIKAEVKKTLKEVYDLEQVKYSPAIKKKVTELVKLLQKNPNLTKDAVASILNDVIYALGLDRTQMTVYMNSIKQYRERFDF
jgi:hypothetical protein